MPFLCEAAYRIGIISDLKMLIERFKLFYDLLISD